MVTGGLVVVTGGGTNVAVTVTGGLVTVAVTIMGLMVVTVLVTVLMLDLVAVSVWVTGCVRVTVDVTVLEQDNATKNKPSIVTRQAQVSLMLFLINFASSLAYIISDDSPS